MRTRSPFVVLLFAAFSTTAAGAVEPTSPEFRTDILPLLSDRCFKCHGPDSANRQAGLRLDRRNLATAKLESGAIAIVPRNAGHSALVQRILSADPDVAMPPPGLNRRTSRADQA